jgi:saccharopine dehydrogenase-like NADP-dependent oxidoreductase
MLKVLVAGAGKSSAHVINYLLDNAKQKWKVIVMDANAEMIDDKIDGHPKGEAAVIDIENEEARQALVKEADIVVSLMPAHLHFLLAKDCIKFKKNLITSSYVSEDMKTLHQEAVEAGVSFMCEMGLDPGIDHMSASSLIHGIQRIAGAVQSFKSYCGGLVAPESDTNPWHYKISWNPRNIVLAGKQGAVWLENNKESQSDYTQLFSNNKKIKVDGVGSLSYYPNRDSLKYLDIYQLQDVKTFMRATLRHPGFMKGWDAVVSLKLTSESDSYEMGQLTYAQWLSQKCDLNAENVIEKFRTKYHLEDKVFKQLEWLGIFDDKKIPLSGKASSADILQTLLVEKWKLKSTDKDLVVMQHQLEYERKGVITKVTSSLVVTGDNSKFSAMSKTVGLPMGILAKKILLNEISTKNILGVHIPVMPDVYVPVLKELKKYGVEFIETIE